MAPHESNPETPDAHPSDTTTDETDSEDTSRFDGRSAALRDAGDSGPLFADRYRPGESGLDAGLIAGTPEDPVLVAGVGYPLLGDLALGTVVAYRVAEWDLPGVAVADCSHTPVAAYQTISAGEHETVVVVGSEKHGGELNDGTPSETPGAIHERDPTDYEISDEEVTARIGESAMGSNTVENVLLVARALDALPEDTRVLTVEPGYDSWGPTVEEFTDPVERALDPMLDWVLDAIEDILGEL
jgi:Ni,Fe-hydrogenase maturation factor